jgi:hypothetical protein
MAMASRFQQQSLRRKFIYMGLIAALFTATIVVRQTPLFAYNLEKQADALELRERNLGEVDLTDKALRLTLTGSRGIAVCGLWWMRDQKKKKNEWNEVELLTRSVIKLQPHFMTPWLFQSWDLAYNVSVECDRVKDKYFYITRGVQLLAEGDRQNRDNPDIRFFTGYYMQNKMGVSDEQHTLRSLFQMSCIDPAERDANRFRQTRGDRPVIDWNQFEDFCRKHPFLVRRLYDYLRCKTPDDVIDFLAANHKIPALFEDRTWLAGESDQQPVKFLPVEERFPVLPPQQMFRPNELTYESALGDSFDGYEAARAWFGYAQDPIEKAVRPRSMMTAVFKGYPARAQAFYAERLEQEGWFDAEGWELRDWFPRDRSRPESGRTSLVVGKERDWSAEAWESAFEMYQDLGERLGFLKNRVQLLTLPIPEQMRIDRERGVINFDHHYHKADTERLKEVVTARKCFFLADRQRRAGDRELALETYERPDALAAWKKILMTHPEFASDPDLQEEMYMMQRKYLTLVRDKRGPALRRLMIMQDILCQAAVPAGAARVLAPATLVQAIRVPLTGPFDDVDRSGRQLIGAEGVRRAVDRHNLPEQKDSIFTPAGSK